MQVGSYAVPDGQGGEVDIPNARIVECTVHGILPADQAENRRWQRVFYGETAAEGPSKDVCDGCNEPRVMTGQFFYYGHLPKVVKLCYECNETIDWRTLSPVRLDD